MIHCDICGMPGHIARKCPLKDLELKKDPVGELQRQRECRERERARLARRNGETILDAPQTSRSFGL